MKTQPASGLVVVVVFMHICVVAFLVLTQAEDSTRYAFTSGLLVVMFPEFDIRHRLLQLLDLKTRQVQASLPSANFVFRSPRLMTLPNIHPKLHRSRPLGD